MSITGLAALANTSNLASGIVPKAQAQKTESEQNFLQLLSQLLEGSTKKPHSPEQLLNQLNHQAQPSATQTSANAGAVSGGINIQA